MRIGIIGLGKIGLPLAVILCKHFNVSGVDISEERIKRVLNRENFLEPQVNEYLEKYGKNLAVATDYNILRNCDVVLIITQTPSLPSGKLDPQYVETALKRLHEENPGCLAVVSSTVNIGEMDKLKGIHEKVCYNPEFIKQGSIIHDFEYPKFVLIGTYNESDGHQVADIWRKIHDKPIYIVKPIEAEIIKISLNVSFSLDITFANAIGEICENFDANSDAVFEIIYKDRRNYKPGLGYGGVCFPRDVRFLEAVCNENKIEGGLKLSKFLQESNEYILRRFYEKIKQVTKGDIAILGVAYKPKIPLIEESQPLQIALMLARDGYNIHIYDPYAEQNAKKVLNFQNVTFYEKLEECIQKCDTVFLGHPLQISAETLRDKNVIDPWKSVN